MRKALDAKASGLMIMLCMIWGLQQVVLKLAAVDIAPIMQIAIRCGLSALMVYPLIRFPQGVGLFSKDYLLAGMWLAFLFSAEFFLVAEALRFTSASHTVVLLYTAPIFVALGLNWKFASERLSALQWTGIFIAFVGIVVTFMGKDSQTGQFSKVLLGGDGFTCRDHVGAHHHFITFNQTCRSTSDTDFVLSVDGWFYSTHAFGFCFGAN